MEEFTEKQKLQEAYYDFPYHYLDLKIDKYRLVSYVQYLSYLKIVENLLRSFNGQLILDAGCGDGRFCYELRNEKVKCVGVDFSENAIRFARAFNPNTEFYVQDLKNLSLPYKFDYVVLIDALEHFVPEEVPIILGNLFDVLKEDGRLVLAVPSTNLPLTVGEGHYQHFTAESLRDTLRDYFRVIKLTGNSKTGFHKKIFLNFSAVGVLLLPFREKLKFINSYYKFLRDYYEKYVEVGKVEDCNRLIAVCEKTKSPQ